MCLASTLYKYDLRKGDLFVLSWARVRRVSRGSMYMTHVCFYVCCCDYVNVCCVAAVVKGSEFFLPWSVEICCVFV